MRQPLRKEHKKYEHETPFITLVIDGCNLAKICTSADKRVNSRGEVIGGIFQFLLQVKLALKIKNFDRVCVFWDGDNSGILRYNLYPEYKANRDKDYTKNQTEYDKYLNNFCKRVIQHSQSKKTKPPKTENEKADFIRQTQAIKECLEELFIRQCCVDDVEGDDLIAHYCLNKKDNEKIIIMSGDRDLTQLINEDVAIYLPSDKKFISTKNYQDMLGYHYENVLIKKIICGDSSDNIKGVKGVGDDSLMKLMPELKERKVNLNEIIDKAKLLNEERIKDKKKPLKAYENIINQVTDGSQGENLYEINEKIINLHNPLMTQKAIDEMYSIINYDIDPEDRGFTNLYKLILKYDITDLKDDNNSRFVNFFEPFNFIINKEINNYKKNNG